MSASRGTTTPPPPPIIGKAGRYTVFITPPPHPSNTPETPFSPTSTDKMSPQLSMTMDEIPVKIHPVQPPPQQFSKIYNEKSAAANENSKSFSFFWNAVAKVQSVHSSVDEYIADWFGLNQSKYQWALNEYYETNGFDKDGQKSKEVTSKGQRV